MEESRRKVLQKLYKKGKIGGAHCSEDEVPKGFPAAEVEDIRDALKELIKENFVLCKPTSYGRKVSINPRRLKEVREILGRN